MHFSKEVINWYGLNKRDLPWRNTKDPYQIWLSEVILQQTRVDQGLSYYLKFIDLFPTVKDLATASEDKVLRVWQGLGYYSRARNLHSTAKRIVTDFNGEFPSNYKDILSLKGVGEYTAAAIASFCFDLPYPVLDGNVYRVFSRFFGIIDPIDSKEGKTQIVKLTEHWLDKSNPATYNQAIMEFGALQCTPKNAKCDQCPLSKNCIALKKGLVDSLPIKSKKIKVRNRYFFYFIVTQNAELAIQQRTKKDIWQQLFEFPLVETETEQSVESAVSLAERQLNVSVKKINHVSAPLKHILSHQNIYATFIHIEPEKHFTTEVSSTLENLNTFALPRLIDKYIELNIAHF